MAVMDWYFILAEYESCNLGISFAVSYKSYKTGSGSIIRAILPLIIFLLSIWHTGTEADENTNAWPAYSLIDLGPIPFQSG